MASNMSKWTLNKTDGMRESDGEIYASPGSHQTKWPHTQASAGERP